MSLSDLAALGSFISGFAVLISLIFLYFQLRQVNAQVLQAEKNQRAMISHSVVTRTMEANRWYMQPDILTIGIKMRSRQAEWSDDEIFKASGFIRVLLGNAQDVYVQHAAGLVDQATFDGVMLSVRNWLSLPAIRAIWKSTRNSFAPEWAQQIDTMIDQTALAGISDLPDRFRTNLAEIL